MSVVISGTISASQVVNGNVTLIFTDTSTGLGTVTSRVLTIYNSNTVLIDTINMGLSTTATYVVTADQYLSFVETISDNVGGPYTGTVNYLVTTFYQTAFANAMAALPPDFMCASNTLNYIDVSYLYFQASERYALSALAPAAQNAIVAANYFITGNIS